MKKVINTCLNMVGYTCVILYNILKQDSFKLYIVQNISIIIVETMSVF